MSGIGNKNLLKWLGVIAAAVCAIWLVVTVVGFVVGVVGLLVKVVVFAGIAIAGLWSAKKFARRS